MVLVCAALAAAPSCAQDPRAAMEASVQKQLASIEKQRASVSVQVRTAQAAPTDAFFAAPWTEPLIMPAVAPQCDPVPEDQIGPMVEEVSQREGLTPDLLRAVIEKESSYLPCALSSSGAQGLMQLMPDTAADLGVQDAFDPRQNVDAGAKFLKQLLDKYGGNLVLALAAYNAGPARVDSAAGVPLIPETLNFVSNILGKLRAR